MELNSKGTLASLLATESSVEASRCRAISSRCAGSEIKVLTIVAWNPIISSGIVENHLSVLHGGSERDHLAALIRNFLADIVSAEIGLLVIDNIVIDEPVSRVVESFSLILAVGADPFQLIVHMLVLSLLPGLASPLQDLNDSGDLDQVGSVHAREVVPNDSTCPRDSVGVDQLIFLASSRSLAGHINGLTDLPTKGQPSGVDGSSFLVVPDADQRAEEENGAEYETDPPS